MTTTLTARGRGLLRLAGFASILVLLFAIYGPKAEGAMTNGNASNLASYQQITVAPGETLWQIALMVKSATGFQGDLRDLVDQIVSLNGLTSQGLAAGSHLTIPVAK